MSGPKEAIEKYRREPNAFLREILSFDPWGKQAEIASSVAAHSRTAIRSCHDSGKTAIAGRITLWFLYTHMPAVVLTTAPTFRQVDALLWRELRRAYRSATVPLGGHLYETPQLNIREDWYAMGLSTDDPTRFQGFHSANILIVFDEAPGIEQPIYDAAEGSLTSEGAKVLMIGNPTALSGEFYDAFHSSRGMWSTASISAFDTPNFTKYGITIDDVVSGTWKSKISGPLPAPYLITPQWVADRYIEWGVNSPLWHVKVMGDFPAETTNTVVTIKQLEQSFEAWHKNALTPEEEATSQHIFGLDVAAEGDDRTVLAHAIKNRLTEVISWTKADEMESAGKVAAILYKHPGFKITIDCDGIGSGVAARLQELIRDGYLNGDIVRFYGAGAPVKKLEYYNARTEAWLEIGKKIRAGTLFLYDDPKISGDLTACRYRPRSDGKLQLEKKVELKKRLGHSPDFGDAVAYCFYDAATPGWLTWFEEKAAPFIEKDESAQETEKQIPAQTFARSAKEIMEDVLGVKLDGG